MKDASGDGDSNCQPSPVRPQEAENAMDVGETKGLCHLSSPHLPQIVSLRVTGVHYQQLPECHLGLTDQMDPDIPDKGDGTERMEPT